MKGHEEHDRGNDEARAVTHEDLCALVLGELEGAEAERVEAALAASPELRAERARLARTIGLVRGALGAPEALSADKRAGLERAASSPVPGTSASTWRPILRAAAGLLVLAGGFVLVRELTDSSLEPARVHDEVARAATALETESGKEELGLLALGDPAPQTDSAALGEDKLLALQVGHVARFGATSPERSEQAGDAKGSDGGSYRGPGDSVPGVGSIDSKVSGGTTGVPGVDSIGDEWFLGHGGQRDSGPAARAREREEHELAALGRPGRREGLPVPPGGGGGAGLGPATPGPRGPVSPGPGGPTQPQTGGVDARFDSALRVELRRARSQAEDPGDYGYVLEYVLEGLGYTGQDAEPLAAESADESARRRASVTGADLDRLDRGRDPRAPRELSSAELDDLVAYRLERLLADCRRRPSERPRDMFFRYWGDNPFVLTQLDPLSTFSVDVDTASYALSRRYLREGHLPEKAQVRTEEFVNYFAPDVEAPREGTFAIHTDLVPTRFGNPDAERWTLRVVLRGKEVSRDERQPLDLVFVIDVSGSMRQGNRLELVKHGLRLLTSQLDARDSIAIVAFSRDARLILPLTSVARRAEIESALHALQPGGGTNTEAGLVMGYDLAAGALDRSRVTRVVLLSDGVANIGVTDPAILSERVRAQRERGIYLNTIGVGMGNHNDVLLEQLANAGDGICNYIDDEREARRALVENFTGAFVPIARDVKIQLEFDPARVARFRQLGYENRAIAHRDFRNDAVDAGEVGAGHQVVALYELELASRDVEAPLGVVRLRWKQPTSGDRDPLEDDAVEIEHPIDAASATSWDGATIGYRRAVVVAQFAELLRRSVHAREISFDEVIAEGTKLATQAGDPELAELVGLMERSRQLVLATRATYGELERCLDLYRINLILRAELEALGHDSSHARIRELERQNAELQRLLSELLRRRVLEEPRRR